MRTAILLHGSGGSDKDYFWFSDLKTYLKMHGYNVWWPLLPATNRPELEATIDYVKRNLPEQNDEPIVIGHSSACPLILSLIQRGIVKPDQAVLVSCTTSLWVMGSLIS